MSKPELLSKEQLDKSLSTRPAPRVTKEQMEGRILKTSFHKLSDDTVTVCNLALDNGYSVRGESACVNPANYDQKIGEKLAYDNAFNKLWPLFGFLLAEDQFRAAPPTKA